MHGHPYARFACVAGSTIFGAVLLASCAPTASAKATSTPISAALSWFKAINHKNLSAAQAHFVPADRDMMDWSGGNTSIWSTFTHVHCKILNSTRTDAGVYCSFKEGPSLSEGNPVSFWTISMAKDKDGAWLINNYGQG